MLSKVQVFRLGKFFEQKCFLKSFHSIPLWRRNARQFFDTGLLSAIFWGGLDQILMVPYP